MLKSPVFLFTILFSAFYGNFHPFYVSVTTITYHDNRFEIVLYTFPDDVAKAIENEYRYTIDWDNPGKRARLYLDMYMHEHLQLFSGDREIDYHYLGFTFENEKLLLLAETSPLSLPSRMKIVNTWLIEIYPSQQNIVHVILETKKFTGILDKTNRVMEINLEEK